MLRSSTSRAHQKVAGPPVSRLQMEVVPMTTRTDMTSSSTSGLPALDGAGDLRDGHGIGQFGRNKELAPAG